ncbi:polysaccharide biosynthesis protein GumL [Stenotrophomonas panacihumi]|uniref:Polysaccharide biosynthesis protein GumL n=1 Tax=Stenotrophomonas panacihumi TaxID=676599 RepID=A0A0R0AZR3_9GAMM|nr:polysaccharide pyruvyl transferase family protein [Stenotrophomonas panacihumi]KRG46392.1 polysaccharide biosynthesis protein GumL [Stenotrophomonas panacihumi]PTN55098.1 polysaccharide pyruvyl transferase family protein [Stenotrophomonas panacihumi]
MPNALLHRWITHAERRAMFWWQPKDGRINMGDQLSQVIVARTLGLRDLELIDKPSNGQRLFAIGSVLHFARTGDTVWGSGINGKIAAGAHQFGMLDVRAVRGPRTRQTLLDRGIPVPEVYGDPGLLMPLFFPPELLGGGTPREVVVVPHFNEPPEKYREFAGQLVAPDCPPVTFMRRLLGAGLVVSSSLHGLILAEAYGIPAVYLDWGNGEDRFKYDDYYRGTGRSEWHAGGSVAECIALGGNGEFDLGAVQRGLLEAFPYDLWTQA